MANTTVYPFGEGQMPSGIGVINDLTTGGANVALAAEQGKSLRGYFEVPLVFDKSYYIKYNGSTASSESHKMTDFVPVQEGDILIYTGENTNTGDASAKSYPIAGYDGRTFQSILLTTAASYTNEVVTIPSGVTNVRVCGISNNSTTPTCVILTKNGALLYEALKDTELLNSASRLGSDTVVSSDKAGAWEVTTPGCTITALDDAGIRLTPGTAVCPGIKVSSFGGTVSVSFEARKVTGVITRLGLYNSANYSSLDNSPQVSCDLKSEWERYDFPSIPLSNDGTGKFVICVPRGYGTRTFDIRNISIKYASRLTKQEEGLLTLQRTATENILKGKKISIIGDSISTCYGNNAVEFTVLESDITNERTLQGYPTYYDIGTTIGDVTVDATMIGVQTSFSPISGDEGKVIGKSLNYNASATYDKQHIWWQILATRLGGEILQNVSWSGASVCSHEGNIEDLKTSYAWHDAQINKLATRDEDGNTINPDVVIIYRGVNDLSHTPYAKLTSFGASAMSIPATDVIEGGYDFKMAYALLIKKIRTAYPNALIICCTLNVFKRVNFSEFPTNNGTNTLPEFNNAIREVADMMGCPVIEFDKDGITFENCYSTYISDSSTTSTHPNIIGHYQMALKAIADVRKM